MPGSVDSICPACEKKTMGNPRGLRTCGHIVCEPCLRSAIKKHSHGLGALVVHTLGAGVDACTMLSLHCASTAPSHDHVPCPLCHTKNEAKDVMQMPALGQWLMQKRDD